MEDTAHSEAQDYFQISEDNIDSLTGLSHHCPLCFSTLRYRPMPVTDEKHWFCPNCNTEWDVRDLIPAMNYNELKEGDDEH